MISIFDLFSIGVGPSSSHTVGPMRAAYGFVEQLKSQNTFDKVSRLTVEVFGSLAFTGIGHGTEKALLMGLEGELPETVNPDAIDARVEAIRVQRELKLSGTKTITFNIEKDLIFNYDDLLPRHSNGMRFIAYDESNAILFQDNYYSIGGGFIITDIENLSDQHTGADQEPFPFDTAEQLLHHCEKEQKTIAEIMWMNETAVRSEKEVRSGILNIVDVMMKSIDKGMSTEGELPGGLNVKRRAPMLTKKMREKGVMPTSYLQADSIDWLNVYAIAVNEENAAGSRVVTAPTNGAAGVLPAVLKYYIAFYPDVQDEKIIEYMLTAAAIAVLYKKGASISAAEVGCQGEVGVACSMAAASLTAVLGATMMQVASAAEIGMEHNLGLTCDPIAGLVQIPCIERNAIGAVKAVNVARLAMLETGEHKKISLDKVIDTMKRTGLEMSNKYKETSQGGLAKIKVNVVEC